MNKKSFFIGLLTGVILTFVGLFAFVLLRQRSDEVQYLEQPISYEHKEKATFKVLQVFDDSALAKENSNKDSFEETLFLGNTVLLLGKGFYSNQIVAIKQPQIIGSYSYTSNAGMPMTVPVIEGEFINP